jgi:hypothetical protein
MEEQHIMCPLFFSFFVLLYLAVKAAEEPDWVPPRVAEFLLPEERVLKAESLRSMV